MYHDTSGLHGVSVGQWCWVEREARERNRVVMRAPQLQPRRKRCEGSRGVESVAGSHTPGPPALFSNTALTAVQLGLRMKSKWKEHPIVSCGPPCNKTVEDEGNTYYTAYWCFKTQTKNWASCRIRGCHVGNAFSTQWIADGEWSVWDAVVRKFHFCYPWLALLQEFPHPSHWSLHPCFHRPSSLFCLNRPTRDIHFFISLLSSGI